MKIKFLSRRKLGIFIVAVLMLSIASITFASDIPVEGEAVEGVAPERPVQTGENIPVEGVPALIEDEIGGDTEIVPFDRQVINVNHIGSTAFDQSFTLYPTDGDRLNVHVKNNHSSKTVLFKVVHTSTNTDFGYKPLGPGEQLTRPFTMIGGGGMSGTWRVYVTSNDGHSMNINVSARQY